MTRLTEALERARGSGHSTPTILHKSGEGARLSVADMPSPWALDEEITGAGEDASATVEVPNAWRLEATSTDAAAGLGESPAAIPAETGQRPVETHEEAATTLVSPDVKSAEPEKLMVGPAAAAAVVEQYRRLAAALHHAQLGTGVRKVMITSAVEAEGKTLTSTNLALTLSESYQRNVLLIDADLRRPGIHQLLKLDNRVGLGDALRGGQPGGIPVQQVSPRLWVMTAGRPDPDPMSGLVSETMRESLAKAADQFDWIIIDTPPVALLPDANLLAAMVDTALLVINAGTTPYPLVSRAIDAIGRSRVLGVVLNRVEAAEVQLGYGYHNYSYGQ